MTDNEIFEKLKEILADINDQVEINRDTALIASGVLDSLELINYLTQIEEVYGVEITLEQLKEEKLGIIENMIQYLLARQ